MNEHIIDIECRRISPCVTNLMAGTILTSCLQHMIVLNLNCITAFRFRRESGSPWALGRFSRNQAFLYQYLMGSDPLHDFM